jgi:hypothetical protein
VQVLKRARGLLSARLSISWCHKVPFIGSWCHKVPFIGSWCENCHSWHLLEYEAHGQHAINATVQNGICDVNEHMSAKLIRACGMPA